VYAVPTKEGGVTFHNRGNAATCAVHVNVTHTRKLFSHPLSGPYKIYLR